MSRLMIYGAKSIALGVCLAVQKLYPGYTVAGFVVKSLRNNPDTLGGLPVWELHTVEDKSAYILIGTPEDTHSEIIRDLEDCGLYHYICIDSRKEAKLMEAYFGEIGRFPSIHKLKKGTKAARMCVYMARYYKDRMLKNTYALPEWICPVSAGAALGSEDQMTDRDDDGDNISVKNGNYCELTALYWMWKNRLQDSHEYAKKAEYYGLYHYRRILDISQEDVLRLQENKIDAVLPFPTVHEPDIFEHHTRYLKEADWQAMMEALEELHPEYAKAYPEILAQPYFYNYNILAAKSSVLQEYCAWLFPILERTEQLSSPKGWERSDRYIGYLGENLLTLYFMYHNQDLNIAHTGRYMLI